MNSYQLRFILTGLLKINDGKAIFWGRRHNIQGTTTMIGPLYALSYDVVQAMGNLTTYDDFLLACAGGWGRVKQDWSGRPITVEDILISAYMKSKVVPPDLWQSALPCQ